MNPQPTLIPIYATASISDNMTNNPNPDALNEQASKLELSNLRTLNDPNGSVQIIGRDLLFPAGKWRVVVRATLVNLFPADPARIRVALADEVVGPATTIYDLSGLAVIRAAEVTDNPSYCFVFEFLFERDNERLISVRAANFQDVGNAITIGPSQVALEKLR